VYAQQSGDTKDGIRLGTLLLLGSISVAE